MTDPKSGRRSSGSGPPRGRRSARVSASRSNAGRVLSGFVRRNQAIMAKTRTRSGAEDPGPTRPPKPGSAPPGEESPSEHDSPDSAFLRRYEQNVKAIKAILKDGTKRTAEQIHDELSS